MVGVRILITGITGFVGSHLAEYALAQGTEVVAALGWRSKTEHIEHLRDRISLFESDLRDLLSVRALLEQARPDYIVHLAAQSFVVASWTTPSETLWTNAICQLNLFEGMRQLGSKARYIVRGYWTLLERGTPGEVYNLCSGVDWSIERVLNFLVGKSTAPRIEIRQDPARLRPSDVPILRGSREKVETTLGWRPAIPLETTLTDLLEYWRRRIRSRVS